jgi:hypothetical protein
MWASLLRAATSHGRRVAGRACGAAARRGARAHARLRCRRAQVGSVDLRSRADCAAKFRSNVQLGGLVFAAAVAGQLTAAGGAASALAA